MSFYNDTTIAVQGQVAGKTLYLMIADVMGTWVVDIVERQPSGDWTQLGWNLDTPNMDKIAAAGGVNAWLDDLCVRMTAFLQKTFGNAPAPTDPKTMEEVRAFVRANAELFSIGMRRK